MNGSHALEFLQPSEVERIVGESCRVLASTGVAVENSEARELLTAAGAKESAGRLRISETSVRAALATVPSHVLLYDRDGAPAIDLGGLQVHFDPGSAAIHVLDATAQRRRAAKTADVIDLVRLVDRLPNYAAQSTAVGPWRHSAGDRRPLPALPRAPPWPEADCHRDLPQGRLRADARHARGDSRRRERARGQASGGVRLLRQPSPEVDGSLLPGSHRLCAQRSAGRSDPDADDGGDLPGDAAPHDRAALRRESRPGW